MTCDECKTDILAIVYVGFTKNEYKASVLDVKITNCFMDGSQAEPHGSSIVTSDSSDDMVNIHVNYNDQIWANMNSRMSNCNISIFIYDKYNNHRITFLQDNSYVKIVFKKSNEGENPIYRVIEGLNYCM